ncbi:Peptidoglycan-binding domain 1 protein [Beutenbergia cavernae DSM 12333]|uniref:Peptidoglycan-binding domain 1 protein n=1 Tax=Beutenbergia cavernae (strain ATCC BAA-8 / DSM 12333 / CCUG 43141 / JCM 11478 / NBRC 16432 / NCIMB 13614 / HKI 0122) TaxID=471853 RepID=C5BW98_BEUC1|nr:peptidoglycan-binding domain-containing protein [Beutenbergia cavernae]ACQ78556.1 Peptidoglycan-binding domain 1 protein [Beutenbergia cavernae DSM 12333]
MDELVMDDDVGTVVIEDVTTEGPAESEIQDPDAPDPDDPTVIPVDPPGDGDQGLLPGRPGGLPRAERTGSAAIQKSLTLAGDGYRGLCLQFVRLCFGVPARHRSAHDAWVAARVRHPGSGTDAPAGTAVFWNITAGKNAPYDHVAISLGGGVCRSTSVTASGIGNVRIADLTARWRMAPYGWTEDLNGYRIVGGGRPPKVVVAQGAAGLKNGDRGPRVKALQQALNRWRSDLPALVADGVFGDLTERRLREWQTRNRGGAYPAAAQIDGVAGPLTLAALDLA